MSDKYEELIRDAIRGFWETKAQQGNVRLFRGLLDGFS